MEKIIRYLLKSLLRSILKFILLCFKLATVILYIALTLFSACIIMFFPPLLITACVDSLLFWLCILLLSSDYQFVILFLLSIGIFAFLTVKWNKSAYYNKFSIICTSEYLNKVLSRIETSPFFQTKPESQEDEKTKKLINKRFSLGFTELKQMMPIIHKLHKMNADAQTVQETYLSDRFIEKEIKKIFETDYSDSEVEKAILFWKDKEMPEKISFMKYLFMFTVLEDGIHKDEWYMLMNVMAKLRINQRYTESLRCKYASLRTEFEEWEYKKSDSADQNSSSNLNPYYMILGLDESASEEEVKKAYHALALQYHPDLPKNADRIQECEEMMAKINEAYEKIRG